MKPKNGSVSARPAGAGAADLPVAGRESATANEAVGQITPPEAYDRWLANTLLGAVPVRPDAHVVDLDAREQARRVRGRGLTTTARDRCLVC